MRDWSTVRHFTREEFRHDPDRISWDTVLLLDEMRDAAGVPFVIHVAWDDSGHESDSSHYTRVTDFATAVDGHFEGWPLLDQWIHAEKFPWSGIGVYPYWTHPGIHVDLRRLGRDHQRMGKRWWKDASGLYRSFDREMLDVLRA